MSPQEKQEHTCRVYVSHVEVLRSQMVYTYFGAETMQITLANTWL